MQANFFALWESDFVSFVLVSFIFVRQPEVVQND